MEVLLNRVKMYSRGGFFGFLDRGTSVDLKNSILNFDLSGLPTQVKQLVMFSVLELVSREMKKDKKPKVVLIDEGWSLLRSKEAENYILDFIKTSRKFNASIGFITQEIEDVLYGEGGRSILNTTSTKILLRQNSSNLELISKTLALNERERDCLLRAEKGQGLMISEQGRYEFSVMASPKIHSLITTDPNEKAAVAPTTQKERNKEEEKLKAPKMNVGRGYYFTSKLSEKRKAELLTKGYVHHTSHIFDPRGCYKVMVLRQSNESPEHATLCWGIAKEIRRHGGKPKVSATVEADVSVKVKGKLISFEVETGEVIEHRGEDYLKEKMKAKRMECDKLYIVVTHRNMQRSYEKLTGVETILRTDVPEVIAGLFM